MIQARDDGSVGRAVVRTNLPDRLGLKAGNVYRPETDKSLNQNF
jgi:hypothetical protein